MGKIANTRSSVSLVCSTMDNVKPIEFSAFVIAEILGDVKSACRAEDASTYGSLIDLVKLIKKKIQKHNYSKAALISVITNDYLNDTSIDDLRELIHDSVFCTFPDSLDKPMAFKSVSAYPPVLRQNYGDEEYESMKITESVPVPKASTPKRTSEAVRIPKGNENACNMQLEKLYNSIMSGVEGEPQYEWQYLIPESKYQELKQSLTEIPAFPSTAKLSGHAAKAIAIYAAEFYKREYDGSNNAFDAINKKKQSDIVERAGIPVYSKNNDALLFSLYVNGGLPVSFLMGRLEKNHDLLVSFLRNLLSEDDFKRSLAIANLSQDAKKLNNTAFKKSLLDKKSLFTQISYITANREVFSAEDIADDNGLYSSFLKMIRRNEALANKFWISYTIYFEPGGDDFSIRPILHLHPETEGERHYALSTTRLAGWGFNGTGRPVGIKILQNPEGKPLCLEDEKGRDVTEIVFTPCMNRDFVESCKRDTFYLPEISKEFSWSDLCLDSYSAQIYDSEAAKDITDYVFKLDKEPYIRLYSRDRYTWQSNKGNQSFPYAAVMFDTRQCRPVDGNYILINSDIGFIQYDYSVRFLIKKKEVVFYNSKGRIAATPTEESLHTLGASSILNASTDNLYTYRHSDGNEERVFIIKDSNPSFTVTAVNENSTINTDLKIMYRAESGDLLPYEGGNPPLGYIKFEVTFDERYYASVPCFVLPAASEIIADSKYNRIIFNNFTDGLTVESDRIPINKGSNKVCILNKLEDDELVQFSVSTDEGSGQLLLQTYYPCNQTIFRADNGVIVRPTGSTKDAVPAILSGHCTKKTVEEGRAATNSVEIHSAKTYNYILDTCFNVMNGCSEPGKNDNGNRFISYSTDFSQRNNDGGRTYVAMAKNNKSTIEALAEQYRFCFLDFKTMSVVDIPANICQEDKLCLCLLDLSEYEEEGMLFQSLKGDFWAPTYFRPHYIPAKGDNSGRAASAKRNDKMERICAYSYGECYSDIAMRSFEIAVEHKMYFSSMDILSAIICEYLDYKDEKTCTVLDDGNDIADRIVKFLKAYLNYCEKEGHAIKYDGLWRLAKEFVFDWVYIPKAIYIENSIPEGLLLKLFRSRPDIEESGNDEFEIFVDRYFSISSAKKHSMEAAEKVKDAIVGPRSMFNKVLVEAKEGGKKKTGKESFAFYRAEFLDKVANTSWAEINKSLNISK